MFGIDDFYIFFQAFFIVFPIVTTIHVLGHYFFAKICGCRDVKIVIGCGRKLFNFKIVEIRMFYFWYGGCELSQIKYNRKSLQLLIYMGGSVFSILSIFILHLAVKLGWIDISYTTYQFTYFTIYTIFFALIPMEYPDGSPSDGKAIINVLRKKSPVKSADCFWK